MLIPLSWLKKYIPLEVPLETLTSTLDLAGIEVDHIHHQSKNFSNVFVAEILNVIPHPDAEKLKIATVFDGTETLQIVCGAPNCRIGIKTALAKIGGHVGDLKIKKGKLRGVESHGMLCGADELGLSMLPGGIIELDLPTGLDFAAHHAEVVLELSLTPNLGHCASVFGIARELASHLNLPLTPPPCNVEEESPLNNIKITIEDENCTHYSCRMIDNLKVAPSPPWLSLHLENAGIRSINNLVDITNYVMLELGQPLHALECEGIKEIHAGKSENLLPFAGILGRAKPSIQDSTTSILLEAARFDPIAVRLSSKALGLRTEASNRFEKGVDPLGVTKALNRAALLMQELAGGKVRKGIQEVVLKPYIPHPIPYRAERINTLLGTSFSLGEVETFLKRLEFTLSHGKATPPSYRNDIHAEIDLVEEVARLYGYNNIPRSPMRYTASKRPHTHLYLIESKMRGSLIGAGLQEFLTCNLISPLLATLSCLEPIHVKHPTSIDQSVLRTSLLPGLLQSLKRNQEQRQFNISAFEIGHVHFKTEGTYKERVTAGILLAGLKADFFTLKGIIENLFEVFNITSSFTHSTLSPFHPGIQASFLHGSLGQVHPLHLQKLDIEGTAFYAEIDLHDLTLPKRQMTPLPLYPGSSRDLTLLIDKTTSLDSVLHQFKSKPSQLLKTIELLDVYESEALGADKRNITLRFFYRHDDKTLSHEAVEKEHERILLALKPKER